MKLLMGNELAEYIKVRQAKAVRTLIQSKKITPRLAIITTIDNPVIDLYVRLKQQYAKDIGIVVDVHRIDQDKVANLVEKLNIDESVHGIIIQLPLEHPEETDKLVNLVAAKKDVDALGINAKFDPATPTAILWLLSGFNINIQGKKVVLVGRGKLVGRPLERILKNSDIDVVVVDKQTKNIGEILRLADVIITATGQPAIIKSEMIKYGAVVVDAGVASENGKTVGDVDDELYERLDITITPRKGGVGPLTICALFDNVINAASQI